MRGAAAAVTLACGAAVLSAAPLSSKQIDRIRAAADVLADIRTVPERAIPRELWDRAECAVVIPSLKKAAFIFGGEYGRGLMSCRRERGWGAPLFVEIGKGSWGLQIGAQSVDLVLLVMNRKGIERMLGNKVSLGADASVAAGPVGRDARAATDAQLTAEVLSYSRTRGVFAGIDLSGGVLKPAGGDNADLYGKKVSARTVVVDPVIAPPPATQPFLDALGRTSRP